MPSPRHTSKLEQTCQRDACDSCRRAPSGRSRGPRRPRATGRRGRARGPRPGEPFGAGATSSRVRSAMAAARRGKTTTERATPCTADAQDSSIRAQILKAARIVLRGEPVIDGARVLAVRSCCTAEHSRQELLQGGTAGEAATASRALGSSHHRLTLARRAVYVGARSDRGESSKLPRTHRNQRLGSRPAQVNSSSEGGLLDPAKPASESGTAAAVYSRLPACAPRVSTSSEVEEIWQLAR